MKRILTIGAIFTLIILVVASLYFLPQLGIANGYVARMTCSCTFGANRNPKEVAKSNFFYSILGWVDYDVDTLNHRVTADFLGLKKRVAEFRNGIGCILVNEEDDFEIPGFKAITPLPTNTFWPRIKNQIIEFDKDQIQKVVQQAFDLNGIYKLRTTAVVVVYRDSIISEKYAPNYNRDMPLLGWSMTKSWMNAFVGLMIKDSLLNIHSKNLFREWKDERRNISLADLLQMQSGLDWEERYDKVSDATTMLYDSDNVARLALNKKLVHPIGSQWYYSSGTTNLIAQYLRNIFNNDKMYNTYLHKKLFSQIGMRNTWLEMDESGTFIGSSYGYATARDWAKFGQLYLHHGKYGDIEILPNDWVRFTTTSAEHSNGKYGGHFWLNKGQEFSDCPTDMYYCDGYLGQFVFIIPSHDLVIVRLGNDGKYFDGNNFVSSIIKCLK